MTEAMESAFLILSRGRDPPYDHPEEPLLQQQRRSGSVDAHDVAAGDHQIQSGRASGTDAAETLGQLSFGAERGRPTIGKDSERLRGLKSHLSEFLARS